MQNKRLVWLAVIILLLGLVMLFGIAYRALHTSITKPILVKTHTVLVVDYDQNKHLSNNDILAGKDAILVVRSPQQLPSKAMWFNSLSALVRMDLNKDGRIDSNDPIYPHMGLAFFNDAMQHKYVSLADAHVKAILIDGTKINEPEDKLINEESVGKVLFKKGDTRALRLLKVEVEL